MSNLLRDNRPAPPANAPTAAPTTFKVQSDLLSRLEAFLPKMKEANEQLDQQIKQDPKSVDIENIDENDGEQYIEMDLGLGVFDLKKNVTEDEIVINPGSAKSGAMSAKPGIVMMDTDKEPLSDDNNNNDTDMAEHSTSDEEDVVMKP
ncbi:hypothetical protein BGW38_008273 [Lunasporangiospora selenospora]|uniref:Uncharacterized protein n=1 Tax=Lunasporangiospora selenospora TaxID=979761 RepID=A0A9P6KGI3_9FUNG|nr:hypothetical protein BGW38_008273 [Lunasporangiospora selenospora]